MLTATDPSSSVHVAVDPPDLRIVQVGAAESPASRVPICSVEDTVAGSRETVLASDTKSLPSAGEPETPTVAEEGH